MSKVKKRREERNFTPLLPKSCNKPTFSDLSHKNIIFPEISTKFKLPINDHNMNKRSAEINI
jgi:hypothetical protein